MKLGIIGLPNAGKSTLFNALTNANVPAENYPFCTIERNTGIVHVPDERLTELQKIYNSQKIVPAIINFVDIAGLVKGASKNEGLGNKFLAHIREVDAIIHIIRCFKNNDVIHVDGSIDPIRDIDTINTELILADIESLEKQKEKSEKSIRVVDDKNTREKIELVQNLLDYLNTGKQVKHFMDANDDRTELINDLFLLTTKPIIYIANLDEEDLNKDIAENIYFNAISKLAKKENTEVIPISAKIENEIAQLEKKEKKDFLELLGFSKTGLERLILASYKLLGLISFYSGNEKEVRAWTIKKGTKAPQAAGKIHTDFEKGFIKAEVIHYDDLIKCGSFHTAREEGKIRTEGKDYIIQENDVIFFKFNL